MALRILSALILIPVVLGIVFFASPLPFALAATALAALAFWEFLKMGRLRYGGGDALPLVLLGILAGFPCFWGPTAEGRGVWAAGFMLCAGALAIARGREPAEALGRVVWPAAGYVYIFTLFSWVSDIRFCLDGQRGAILLVFFLLIQWVGDTMAYATGRLFGKRKLIPFVSPGKTVAGALGGLAGSAAVGLVMTLTAFPGHSPAVFAAAALLLGAAGQVGDLLESLFKRCCGVKDSSGLIPGHGGMLDRIDSLLFTAPLFFFLFRSVLRWA